MDTNAYTHPQLVILGDVTVEAWVYLDAYAPNGQGYSLSPILRQSTHTCALKQKFVEGC